MPSTGTRTQARRLATSIAIAVGMLLVVDLVLRIETNAVGDSVLSTIQGAVTPVTLTVLGALVASRRPANPIGWLMLAGSLLAAVDGCAKLLAVKGLLDGAPPGGWVRWPAWFQNWSSILPITVVVLIFLLFPDGRLPFPLARWAAGSLVIVLGSLIVLTALDPSRIEVTPGLPHVPNPTGIAPIRGFESGSSALGALWFLLAIPLALALATLIVRLRRSGGAGRQQLTLVVYAAGASLLVITAGVILATTAQERGTSVVVGDIVIGLGTNVGLGLVVPGVIAMTILRHRMYDVDRLVNRTLVYTLLSVVLAALYAGLVLGLGTVTRSLSDRSSRGVVVATSTLAVAALFRPLRRRVQSVIDRRFYRRRYDAAQTIRSFASRLRTEADLEVVRRDLVSVVSETMQPVAVSVWLGRPPVVGASHGRDLDPIPTPDV